MSKVSVYSSVNQQCFVLAKAVQSCRVWEENTLNNYSIQALDVTVDIVLKGSNLNDHFRNYLNR